MEADTPVIMRVWRRGLSSPSMRFGCPLDWMERQAATVRALGFLPPSHGSVKLTL